MCFGVLCPPVLVFVLLVYFFRISTDLDLLANNSRIAIPQCTIGIEDWNGFYDYLSYVSFILIIATQFVASMRTLESVFQEEDFKRNLSIVILIEHLFFILKTFMAMVIPDEPEWVGIIRTLGKEKMELSDRLI